MMADNSSNISESLNFKAIAIPIYEAAIPSMMFLCMAAFSANIFVLASAASVRVPLNPALKLAFSLSAADAWTSVVILVGLLINSYFPIVKRITFDRQQCFSYALEAFRLGGMISSVLHLLVLSIFHFAAIAYPVVYRELTFSAARVNAIIGFCWIAPPLGFLLLFAGNAGETFNAVECNSHFINHMGFRLVVFIMILIPMMLMIAVYVKIISLLSSLKCAEKDDRSSQRRENFVKRKSRTVVTGMLIVSTFLIGWIPSSVMFALTCEVCLYPHEKIMPVYPRLLISFSITVNCLIIIKGLLNPLIYCIRIPEISDALKRRYAFCLLLCPEVKTKNLRSGSSVVSTNLNANHTDACGEASSMMMYADHQDECCANV